MTTILPVVLAGGSGNRLWPLSCEFYPKQFLALTDSRSMMQETLLRLAPMKATLDPCIVCNEEHRFLVAEQCREVGQPWSTILLEHTPRDTAPALALVACHTLANGDDPVLLVVPSDGYIENADRFRAAVAAGVGPVETGHLITFGIQPLSPETGYGYIRTGETLDGCVRRVAEFIEKPNREAAERFVESGAFLWNSGIFLFRASTYVAALARHASAVLECCRAAVESGSTDLDFFRPGPELARAPKISIDYAVMEKTSEAAVVPLDTGWSDMGSWQALHELSAVDGNNNALTGDVVAVDTTNSLVHAASRLVTTVGVERLIVVETADAVLVADWESAQNLQDVVECSRELLRSEHRIHRRVHRPWGSFETIEAGKGYQVKRLSVKPGAQLSLQIHRYRSEHWVVIHGTAQVTCGESTLTLSENQSTYIPRGSPHRLRNLVETPLELIEVQVGDYLGEDDIIRLADDFGRGTDREGTK